MNKKTRVYVLISGKVQGVFFRESTRKKALSLDLTGWVRNLSDSRVEAVFEGEKEKIERMIFWIKKGPRFSRVENIEVKEEKYLDEFESFRVVG